VGMAVASRCVGSLLAAVIGAMMFTPAAPAEPVDTGESAQSVIDNLKSRGCYNVVINWLTGYDTVPLAVCTVESVDNPDDSKPKPGAFTTVYVNLSCPNHPDE
jgi:hypothetical protein